MLYKHRYKITAAVIIVCVLAASFVLGGGYARSTAPPDAVKTVITEATEPDAAISPDTTEKPNPPARHVAPETPEGAEAEEPSAALERREDTSEGVVDGDAEYSEEKGMELNPETGKDMYLTDPVPEGKPLPVEPQDASNSDVEYTCTLSVRCDTILDNMMYLDKEKHELVPEDGVILSETTVTFYEGESVFNVLRRELKRAGIHMEFVNTPIYNSAYIEGINNLYEFDVGELSGWMYSVTPRDTGNRWFPNYGCSRYQLQDGDVVEWVYTCDLGRDVGGFYAIGE